MTVVAANMAANIKRAQVDHLASVYSKMQRAEGSLTTGTYICVCEPNTVNHVVKVDPKGDGNHRLLSTKDRNDQNTEVCMISTPACFFDSHSLVLF